jgi:hypothetical protein
MAKSNEENQFTGSKQRQQQLRRREGEKPTQPKYK